MNKSITEVKKVQNIISALLAHYGVTKLPDLEGKIIDPSKNEPYSLSAIYKWRREGVFPADKFPLIDQRFRKEFFETGEGSPYTSIGNEGSQTDRSGNKVKAVDSGVVMDGIFHRIEIAALALISEGRFKNKSAILRALPVPGNFFEIVRDHDEGSFKAGWVHVMARKLGINPRFLIDGDDDAPILLESAQKSMERQEGVPDTIVRTLSILDELLGDQSPEVRSDPVIRRLSIELSQHLLAKKQLLRPDDRQELP